jgi:NAD(P)-dependent dehydrogenase (short-subunit alcohol dehydrogenase family)
MNAVCSGSPDPSGPVQYRRRMDVGPGDELDLTGRVAVVTGAASGIGGATVDALAAHGASVLAVDIDEPALTERVAGVEASGGNADEFVGDVTDPRVVDQVAVRAEALGGAAILVNNVGHWVQVVPFVESDAAHWQRLHEINTVHVYAMTHALLPQMIDGGGGSIVNVTSVEGIRAYPPDPVYGACKAAVNHFTRSLAGQVGRNGVRVNAVAPDVTDSVQVPYDRMVPPEQADKWPDWVPVGRRGEPDDQAAVIVFLASDQSRFVTGQVLPVDGGTTVIGGWVPTARRGGWTNRPLDP